MERFWRWLSRRNPTVVTFGSGILLLWAATALILFFMAESRERARAAREPRQEEAVPSETGIVRLGDARPLPGNNPFMSPVVQRWLDARREEARAEAERAAAAEEARRRAEESRAEEQPVPPPPRTIALLYRGLMTRVDGAVLALVQQDDDTPFYVRIGDPLAGGMVQRITRQGMEWVVDDETVLLPLGEAVRVEEPAP